MKPTPAPFFANVDHCSGPSLKVNLKGASGWRDENHRADRIGIDFSETSLDNGVVISMISDTFLLPSSAAARKDRHTLDSEQTPRALFDPFDRPINYIRVSVTDRCNLRCQYCMPKEGVSKEGHTDILHYEEILRLTKLAVPMGFSKVRVTGGEPLARRNILFL